MKKKIASVLLLAVAFCGVFGFSSCKNGVTDLRRRAAERELDPEYGYNDEA